MPYKVNLFFSSNQVGESSGWSETYYHLAATNNQATLAASQLAAARQNILAGAASLDYVRLSDDNVKRDGFVFKPGLAPRAYETKTADYSFVAAECRLFSSLQVWRHLYVRGVPDFLHSGADDTDNALGLAWITACNAYLAAVSDVAAQWAIKTFDRSGQLFPISGIVVLDDDRLMVVCGMAHGFVPGDHVHFAAVGRPSPRLGTRAVLSPRTGDPAQTNLSFIVQGNLPRGFSYSGIGGVEKYVPIYQKITVAQYVRARHRDTGRPFGQPRGRAPARRL